MRDTLKFGYGFLAAAFDAARDRHGLSAAALVPLLMESPVFDPERTLFFEQGIEAYLTRDFVKMIHVLLPQIEHTLRRLLGQLGRATSKRRSASDSAVMVERTLNEILDEPDVERILGPDVTAYFRMLFCDARGYNLRNEVAHGLLPIQAFNRFSADWTLHALLVLSLLREKRPTDSPEITDDCENGVQGGTAKGGPPSPGGEGEQLNPDGA